MLMALVSPQASLPTITPATPSDITRKSFIVVRVVAACDPPQPMPAQLVERPERRALPPPEAHHRDHALAESPRDRLVERVPGLRHEGGHVDIK